MGERRGEGGRRWERGGEKVGEGRVGEGRGGEGRGGERRVEDGPVCFALLYLGYALACTIIIFLHRPGGAKSPVSVPHNSHWTVAAATSQLAVMTRPLQITTVTRSLRSVPVEWNLTTWPSQLLERLSSRFFHD